MHIAKDGEEIPANHAVEFDIEGFEGDDIHERADDFCGGLDDRFIVHPLLVDECQEGVSIVQLEILEVGQPGQLFDRLSVMTAIGDNHLGNAGHVPPLNQGRHPAGMDAHIGRLAPPVN